MYLESRDSNSPCSLNASLYMNIPTTVSLASQHLVRVSMCVDANLKSGHEQVTQALTIPPSSTYTAENRAMLGTPRATLHYIALPRSPPPFSPTRTRTHANLHFTTTALHHTAQPFLQLSFSKHPLTHNETKSCGCVQHIRLKNSFLHTSNT